MILPGTKEITQKDHNDDICFNKNYSNQGIPSTKRIKSCNTNYCTAK